MPHQGTLPTNQFLPILLVRGFDPLAQSPQSTYYGFNDGTVYPHKLGDDYIYEGMLLKFLKTRFKSPGQPPERTTSYQDATNAIRYVPYREEGAVDAADAENVRALQELLGTDAPLPPEQMAWLIGPAILDPHVAMRFKDIPHTLWVYRYYDFKYRDVPLYAHYLRHVVDMVKAVTGAPGVNLICHSMGGLVARYLIQNFYADRKVAETHINKWVTLGTPHRGIAFHVFRDVNLWEIEVFNRENLEAPQMFGKPLGKIDTYFDPNRILCIVGTNHRAYAGLAGWVSGAANQIVSWLQGQDQNHSDGLVKQECATLIGAHRADVYKCHGGPDSLVTSREAFELATRFFFGDVRATVRVRRAEIKKRYDGYNALAAFIDRKPEFYIGFSVKPRKVDFYLHQQDKDSENCFGPFDKYVLEPSDFRLDSEDTGRDGVIFEGFFNSALARTKDGQVQDLVFRLDTYLGERDAFLLGHSDTVIVNQQSYFKAEPQPSAPLKLTFFPKIQDPQTAVLCQHVGDGKYQLDLNFDTPGWDPDLQLALDIEIEGL